MEDAVMAKAYWIACYRETKNAEALGAYAKLAVPALSQAGGRPLARGIPAKAMEAGLKERTVLIEFDSLASAIAAYESPAYQAALKLLGDAVVRDLRIVEGVA